MAKRTWSIPERRFSSNHSTACVDAYAAGSIPERRFSSNHSGHATAGLTARSIPERRFSSNHSHGEKSEVRSLKSEVRVTHVMNLFVTHVLNLYQGCFLAIARRPHPGFRGPFCVKRPRKPGWGLATMTQPAFEKGGIGMTHYVVPCRVSFPFYLIVAAGSSLGDARLLQGRSWVGGLMRRERGGVARGNPWPGWPCYNRRAGVETAASALGRFRMKGPGESGWGLGNDGLG